jgi:hypothetical protein
VVGNIFAIGYLGLLVGIWLFTAFGFAGALQQTTTTNISEKVTTSFSIGAQGLGFLGLSISVILVFLVWKLFHMFLDMYDAMAQMQSRIANGGAQIVERKD